MAVVFDCITLVFFLCETVFYARVPGHGRDRQKKTKLPRNILLATSAGTLASKNPIDVRFRDLLEKTCTSYIITKMAPEIPRPETVRTWTRETLELKPRGPTFKIRGSGNLHRNFAHHAKISIRIFGFRKSVDQITSLFIFTWPRPPPGVPNNGSIENQWWGSQ